MKHVFITGMSGTGKSTAVEELAARGYQAVVADKGGFSEVVAVPDDQITGLGRARDRVRRQARIQHLVDTQAGADLSLGGCSPNQGRFYPQVDHVVTLTEEEVASALALLETVKPLLRQSADCVIETAIPLDEVVKKVLVSCCTLGKRHQEIEEDRR